MKPRPIELLGDEFVEELDCALSCILHDVKAPISMIRDVAEFLGEENAGALNDTQKQLVDIIGKSARKLFGQMEYVALYRRLRLWDTPDRELIPLAQLLERIRAEYKNHYLGGQELRIESTAEGTYPRSLDHGSPFLS